MYLLLVLNEGDIRDLSLSEILRIGMYLVHKWNIWKRISERWCREDQPHNDFIFSCDNLLVASPLGLWLDTRLQFACNTWGQPRTRAALPLVFSSFL